MTLALLGGGIESAAILDRRIELSCRTSTETQGQGVVEGFRRVWARIGQGHGRREGKRKESMGFALLTSVGFESEADWGEASGAEGRGSEAKGKFDPIE